MAQLKLPTLDEYFLTQRLEESRAIVQEAIQRSEKPIIIQFSGGKDSMAMVGLVREVTMDFFLSFMTTGIEFADVVDFASMVANDLGHQILFSDPSLHKGGFFERLGRFREWPTVHKRWCMRDLKVRPQKKMLNEYFGRGAFYKMVGVRRWESNRRKYIYPHNLFIRRDTDVSDDYLVFPILNWTDDDVVNYLEMTGLPTSGLYGKYGVSGCYWCPFYQEGIYRRILAEEPALYDEFIEWEHTLGKPSVIGEVYLGGLREEVIGYGAGIKDREESC